MEKSSPSSFTKNNLSWKPRSFYFAFLGLVWQYLAMMMKIHIASAEPSKIVLKTNACCSQTLFTLERLALRATINSLAFSKTALAGIPSCLMFSRMTIFLCGLINRQSPIPDRLFFKNFQTLPLGWLPQSPCASPTMPRFSPPSTPTVLTLGLIFGHQPMIPASFEILRVWRCLKNGGRTKLK